MMNRFFRLTEFVVALLLSAVVLVGCSDNYREDSYLGDDDTSVEVVMPVKGSTSDVATRTAISDTPSDNTYPMTWVVGDQVALWADVESSGEAYLVGETFQLKYFGSTYDTAEFAGSISKAMTEQQYSYRGFYPVPQSISGKSVTYEISAVQSGAFDGDLDFRVADPVVGRELTESTMGGVDALSFRSIMHAFKITIPKDKNDLSDNPIKQLIVTMPTDVVGNFSFDMSDTSATPTENYGSSVVTLNLDEENYISEGDGKYAWMFFNPTTIAAGSKITFAAVDTAGVMSGDYELTLEEDRTFAAARITPINIYVPKETTITSFEVTIGDNDVNDVITDVKISASGVTFLESNSSSVTFEVSDEKNDVLRFSYDTSLNTTSAITVKLESKYTTTSYTIAAADIAENVVNSRKYDIPVLLYEDFSTIKAFEYNSALSTAEKNDDLGSDTPITLSSSTYGLSTAWTGVRVGGSSTYKSLRVAGREVEGTKKVGSLTSPALSRLKTDANAPITVTYDYSGNEAESGKKFGLGWYVYPKYGYPIYYFYSTTDSTSSTHVNGANHGSTSTSSSDTSFTGAYNVIDNYDKTIKITGANSTTTLKWTSTCTKSDDNAYQNGNYWLYLDNIKVVITK